MPHARIPEPATIISHLESLTSHRDVTLLNVSVMTSLIEFLGLQHIRLYDVIERDGQFFISISAWNENSTVQCNDGPPSESSLEAVNSYPDLAACIEKGASFSKEQQDGEYVNYVPVLLHHQVAAVFSIHRLSPLSEHELDLVNGIVGVYRNYLSLLEDSQHDTLTGLLNRKTFDHGLAVLLSSIDKQLDSKLDSEERRTILAETHWLAIIDIDHFKRINDQYGHLYGDEVLILMANLMRKEFRQRDRLYRFGGEEFIVLMRNVDFEGAFSKLERFRNAVSAHAFPQVGHVTVTIGFDQVRAADTSAMVLGHADEALYYGKEHGRDQVNCYSTLLEHALLPPKQYHTDAELF